MLSHKARGKRRTYYAPRSQSHSYRDFFYLYIRGNVVRTSNRKTIIKHSLLSVHFSRAISYLQMSLYKQINLYDKVKFNGHYPLPWLLFCYVKHTLQKFICFCHQVCLKVGNPIRDIRYKETIQSLDTEYRSPMAYISRKCMKIL
jgi:hypothetical protein